MILVAYMIRDCIFVAYGRDRSAVCHTDSRHLEALCRAGLSAAAENRQFRRPQSRLFFSGEGFYDALHFFTMLFYSCASFSNVNTIIISTRYFVYRLRLFLIHDPVFCIKVISSYTIVNMMNPVNSSNSNTSTAPTVVTAHPVITQSSPGMTRPNDTSFRQD